MNLKRMMFLAGSAYAVGRLTSKLTGTELRLMGEKLRHLGGDDIRNYAYKLTDPYLERAGYVRRENVSNGAAMMIGGMGAGILVGAGLALLFAPQSGTETRHMINERIQKVRKTNGEMHTSPETTGATGPQHS